MLVAITGPDRVGKTTLFNSLKGRVIAHFVPGVPTPAALRPHMRYVEELSTSLWTALYDPSKVYIADRCPYVDNLVYAKVYGRHAFKLPLHMLGEVRVLLLTAPHSVLAQRRMDEWDPRDETAAFDWATGFFRREVIDATQSPTHVLETAVRCIRDWIDQDRNDPGSSRILEGSSQLEPGFTTSSQSKDLSFLDGDFILRSFE